MKNREDLQNEARHLMRMPPHEMILFLQDLEDKNELRPFLEETLKDEGFKAYLSYYQKWFEEIMSEENKKLVENIIQAQKAEVDEVVNRLPLGLESKYTPEELFILLSNIDCYQITFGCQTACDFCAYDAPAKVREHIPFHQIENMLEDHDDIMRDAIRRHLIDPIVPYFASDITNYRPKREGVTKKPKDIMALLIKHLGEKGIHITTRGMSKEDMKTLAKTNGPRLSTAGLPKKERIAKLAKIKGSSIKSAHKELHEMEDAIGTRITDSEDIKDARAYIEENLMLKLGLNYVPDEKTPGILASSAMLLTPRGLYNVISISHASEQFPQGVIPIPFEGFKVPENMQDISTDTNIRDYLSHGVVVSRHMHSNRIHILYNGYLYFIKFTAQGQITEVDKFKPDDYKLGSSETPIDYIKRLKASLASCNSFENREEFSKKFSEYLMEKIYDGTFDSEVQTNIFKSIYPLLYSMDLGFLETWDDNKLTILLKNLYHGRDAILTMLVYTEIIELKPEIFEKFARNYFSLRKFWRDLFGNQMYWGNPFAYKLIRSAVKNDLINPIMAKEYLEDLKSELDDMGEFISDKEHEALMAKIGQGLA